jgi:hypothetical protein
LKDFQSLKCCGEFLKVAELTRRDQTGVGIGDKAQRASNGDIAVAD